MEVECRIIAVAMEIRQLQSLDDVPQENHLPSYLNNETVEDKRKFLEQLSAVIVDTYILQLTRFALELI